MLLSIGQLTCSLAANAQPQDAAAKQSSAAGAADYDRRLIRIVSQTPATTPVYRSVVQGLAFLPPKVKQLFLAHGVTVVITPSLESIGKGPGHSEYDPGNKWAIICERSDDATPMYFRRLHVTTLHELGHAYDHLLGYPSRQAAFKEIYASEAALIRGQDREKLSYFLQPGNNGPRECFASLFACRYYQGPDPRLTLLRASFPKSLTFVEGLPE